MQTAIAAEDAHEAGARRALLERLATYMEMVATTEPTSYSCCWISYTGPGGQRWLWQMCNGGQPGRPAPRPCDHWHHRNDVFLARG